VPKLPNPNSSIGNTLSGLHTADRMAQQKTRSGAAMISLTTAKARGRLEARGKPYFVPTVAPGISLELTKQVNRRHPAAKTLGWGGGSVFNGGGTARRAPGFA
jgi:hypothetical protein